MKSRGPYRIDMLDRENCYTTSKTAETRYLADMIARELARDPEYTPFDCARIQIRDRDGICVYDSVCSTWRNHD